MIFMRPPPGDRQRHRLIRTAEGDVIDRERLNVRRDVSVKSLEVWVIYATVDPRMAIYGTFTIYSAVTWSRGSNVTTASPLTGGAGTR